MKISPKLFAQLCESVVAEVSTMKKLVAYIPHGKTLLHVLHARYDVPHDQEWIETDDVSWKKIKETRHSWIILRCRNGVAAISWNGNVYTAITVKDGNIEKFDNDRAGYAKDFIKEQVGPIRKIFVGIESQESIRRRYSRHRLKAIKHITKTISIDDLYKRFMPLFRKTIEHCIADIKGVTQNMIKNNAFKKVDKKLHRLKSLENILDQLDDSSMPDHNSETIIKTALNNAVTLAASHYYEELAGEIQRQYGGNLHTSNYEARNKLLQDIANGDTNKLGAVLRYFKRGLL